MNIMELGALGEFVGAFAVVATLIYLAIQVRHGKASLDANTSSVRAQITQARADNQTTFYREAMHSDHWPAIIAKRSASENIGEWASTLTQHHLSALGPKSDRR